MDRTNNVKRALISVSDKAHLKILAQVLLDMGWEILSTGGSAKFLREQGYRVTDIKDFTASDEILSGRVKTLHPKVFSGILFDRDAEDHINQIVSLKYQSIDLVAVNFYPFEEKAIKAHLSSEESIEFIDIGGPSMIRAAAKNYAHVIPLIDPNDYALVEEQLRTTGNVNMRTRAHLAAKVFKKTSLYDHLVAEHLASGRSEPESDRLEEHMTLALKKQDDLRYGENPHQSAALYQAASPHSPFSSKYQLEDVCAGKGLSYNNYLDLDAACRIVTDFEQGHVTCIIKHTNACGVALSPISALEATHLAWASDPLSAFGSVVGLNQCVTEDVAQFFSDKFIECLIAPDFSQEALNILKSKKNLRALRYRLNKLTSEPLLLRQTQLGFLGATDFVSINPGTWRCATLKTPSPEELLEMIFAFKVVKNLKSNAIAISRDRHLLAMGAGATSRIDALKHALLKAQDLGHKLEHSVLASDAFFPFLDCIELAFEKGIRLFVQPGGSIRDEESIQFCNKNGLTMMFTDARYFYH